MIINKHIIHLFDEHERFVASITSLQLTVVGHVQSDVTSGLELAILSHLSVLLASVLGETPLLGHHNLLATRELHSSTTESLHDNLLLIVLSTDGNQRLTNSHTSDQTVGLSVSVTHTSLQSIGTGAGKHLVDTGDVEGVSTHSHVESVLTSVLDEVLVGSNTASLQSLRGNLLTLIGQDVGDEGVSIDAGGLVTNIEDSDLGIYLLFFYKPLITRNSTAEAGLDERLVLAVTVATSGTATHVLSCFKENCK